MADLLDDIPGRALAVYAHPDDPEVSCGGTLARWASSGCHVEVVICARGDKGSADPDRDPDELARARAVESAAAATRLGIAASHHLGYDDGEVLNDSELRRRLVGIVRAARPDVVVAPDPTAVFFGQSWVNHRDHREVGWAVLDAVAPAAASPLYFPGEGPAHAVATLLLSGTLEPDVFVDVSDHVDAKAEALLCHETQLGDAGEWLRQVVAERAAESGREAGVSAAESFRRIVLG